MNEQAIPTPEELWQIVLEQRAQMEEQRIRLEELEAKGATSGQAKSRRQPALSGASATARRFSRGKLLKAAAAGVAGLAGVQTLGTLSAPGAEASSDGNFVATGINGGGGTGFDASGLHSKFDTGVRANGTSDGITAYTVGNNPGFSGVFGGSGNGLAGSYGVYGSGGNGGIGVNGTSVNAAGVHGDSSTAVGVEGIGATAGVSGRGGNGVAGYNPSPYPAGNGGFFQGNTGVFGTVRGVSLPASAPNVGVYGFGGGGASVTGVRGDSDGGVGVVGVSISDYGVQGFSSTNTAVYGVVSDNGIGVVGTGGPNGGPGVVGNTSSTFNAGVYGADNSGGAGHGVWGNSMGGIGAYGQSTTGTGVRGDGAYGGFFMGTTAPLHLVPGTTTGHPTTGTFQQGDLYLDQHAALFLCTLGGTYGPGTSPPTWVQLGTSPVSQTLNLSAGWNLVPGPGLPTDVIAQQIDAAGGNVQQLAIYNGGRYVTWVPTHSANFLIPSTAGMYVLTSKKATWTPH